jgi:hypothetical protein
VCDFGEVRGCRGCRSRRRGMRKSRGRTGKFAGISRKASKHAAGFTVAGMKYVVRWVRENSTRRNGKLW